MRLAPLYRVQFSYVHSWRVDIQGELGQERALFLWAEGSCEGRVAGTFRGANAPRRRVDEQFMPDFKGVIETGDGVTILCEYLRWMRPHAASCCVSRVLAGGSTLRGSVGSANAAPLPAGDNFALFDI